MNRPRFPGQIRRAIQHVRLLEDMSRYMLIRVAEFQVLADDRNIPINEANRTDANQLIQRIEALIQRVQNRIEYLNNLIHRAPLEALFAIINSA
ncbi:hypothetical protein VE03_10469 [Pseudogymnoascus sp. 23342-1-I1]|nr:hypothetical protein VE03_10469 [Pseudogymnoascus sp. 23342-1-I1]